MHIGIIALRFEIERRGLYIYKLQDLIKDITKNCEICLTHKLNKFIKPLNEQILSSLSIRKSAGDLTYFSKKIELLDLHSKYLLNFKDHFSKKCKGYILKNKTAEFILEKFKDFIKTVGKPEIFHTDNGGEFTAKIIKKFCIENDIKIITGGVCHPQSQGAVEAFNKFIIEKLRYFKLEDKKNLILIKL